MAAQSLTKAQIISIVRRRIGDILQSAIDNFVSDGVTISWELDNYPCIPSSYYVYVDGTLQTEGVAYTMSTDGLMSFTVGNVPGAGSTIEVQYEFIKLSDTTIWEYIADGITLVHMWYDFGTLLNDALTDFETDPTLPAGSSYALQAAILILEGSFEPLSDAGGIMIRHGDETVDTKTTAITKKDMLKGMNEELKKLLDRYIFNLGEPYIRE